MMNSNNSLTQNLQFNPSNDLNTSPETGSGSRFGALLRRQLTVGKVFVLAFVLVAALGLADSIYLTVEHYLNAIPPCTFSNCEIVLTSKYSSVFGVPVSLLGAIYYALVTVLSVLYLQSHSESRNRYLITAFLLTHLGLVASLYFTFIQGFVIGSWCPYCLLSAVTSTTLWLMGRYGLRRG